MKPSKNVLGSTLISCSSKPLTGWFRDGCCNTDEEDTGSHTVCAEMTAGFLAYSRTCGNDLSKPSGSFPGLKPGDKWCVCAERWKEALDVGLAPPVILAATHEDVLQYVTMQDLLMHAIDVPKA